jgi:hypothetical protein
MQNPIPKFALLATLFSCNAYAADPREDIKRSFAPKDDICICGYNSVTYCSGNKLYEVSDCYTERGNYCGSDSQYVGSCWEGPVNATPFRNRGFYKMPRSKLHPRPS